MTYDQILQHAREIITAAEADLGQLTEGQRRDLLMDNTPWCYPAIQQIVADIRYEDAA